MGKAKRFTIEERRLIRKCFDEGLNFSKTAKKMNRSKTGILHEVAKNGGKELYDPEKATEESKQRILQGYLKISNKLKENNGTNFVNQYTLKHQLDNLQMQIDILTETVKELKNK